MSQMNPIYALSFFFEVYFSINLSPMLLIVPFFFTFLLIQLGPKCLPQFLAAQHPLAIFSTI